MKMPKKRNAINQEFIAISISFVDALCGEGGC
jgi:hypothetical protein